MAYETPIQPLRVDQLQTQPDEGYSEETQSIAGSDADTTRTSKPLSESAHMVLQGLESLSLEDRIGVLRCATGALPLDQQLAYLKDALYAIPTWAKLEVSSHLDSLMFFDPIRYFPYEIVQTILSHLSPKDLLNAAAVSRGWHLHTQDEELWRTCFKREGWRVDGAKIRAAETAARDDVFGPKRRDSRKRRLEEAFNDGPGDYMEGIEIPAQPGSWSTFNSPNTRGNDRRRVSAGSATSMDTVSTTMPDMHFRIKPLVMQPRSSLSDDPKVSWAYLYKQRRLLEKNWDQGNYQMFRLPHPKYEAEGHAECVYTIQHVGSTLVSGSRDRTIRRWDLETCRLKGAPLHGHDASVLCLQFDPAPEHDIIVSGGSDSWVIIWRFSTGEIIKKMTTAHSESVLNLRFDDRYIVTCSKDKTIKIWNRRAINTSETMLPQYVLPRSHDTGTATLVPEYSLLAKLCGHQAAVNAVMIHGDKIVSASGDRVIKTWSIKSGRCVRTYTGHTKGIACVQYDGRRIVSGSSDNTVRVFDAEQQAEVACLHGHTNLVRTVQARFGDLEVTTDQELHDEARRADMRWSKAMAMGAKPASGSVRGKRNTGSSRPEDMLAIGAKVPPGGGGTKWAKIVSGSYDETVIIWRKDPDGKWTARHTLHQDMLARQRLRINRPPAPPGTVMPGAFPPQNVLNAPGTATVPNNTPNMTTTTTITTTTATVAPNTDQPSLQPLPTQATAAGSSESPTAQDTTTTRPRPQQGQVRPPATRAEMQALQSMQAPLRDSNRVFKLQFDTRRIVCCSQNKVIVGWDFAAGNEDLARVSNWCEETY